MHGQKTSHLPIRYFLALLWAHPILDISKIRVNITKPNYRSTIKSCNRRRWTNCRRVPTNKLHLVIKQRRCWVKITWIYDTIISHDNTGPVFFHTGRLDLPREANSPQPDTKRGYLIIRTLYEGGLLHLQESQRSVLPLTRQIWFTPSLGTFKNYPLIFA